jgi:hypothetical protein
MKKKKKCGKKFLFENAVRELFLATAGEIIFFNESHEKEFLLPSL